MNIHQNALFCSLILTSALSLLGSDTRTFKPEDYPATVPLLLNKIEYTSIKKVEDEVFLTIKKMELEGDFEGLSFSEAIRIDDNIHTRLEGAFEGSLLHYPILLSFNNTFYSIHSNTLTQKIFNLIPTQTFEKLKVNGPHCTGTLDEYTQFEAERQANSGIKITCTTRIRDKYLIKETLNHCKRKSNTQIFGNKG